jgi:D-arabinose 1-dehydrogenase-like Zn-dependent alcohol dehydrogenase
MTKMRAMIVPEVRGQFRMEEFDLPKPGRHEVLIRVHACGVCHSDSFTVEGLAPGITYPRIPGHEVIGVIEALGPDVDGWNVGERAGVGWFGGSCGYCRNCRRGDAFACQTFTASPASPATEVTPRICSRLPRRWPRFPPP